MARIVLNPLASSSLVPSSTGKLGRTSNSYLLAKRNVSTTATTTSPMRTNDGLSLDRPFGAPNYVQFASIDRQQEISKVLYALNIATFISFIHHSTSKGKQQQLYWRYWWANRRKLINQCLFVTCSVGCSIFPIFLYIHSQDGTDLVIRKTECSTSPGSSRGVIEGTRRQTERIVAKNEPADVVVRPILCSTWSHYTAASGIFASIFRVNNNSLKRIKRKQGALH